MNFFAKREPRKFGFTPYYYSQEERKQDDTERPRIKFTRIRQGSQVSQKSIRWMALIALLLMLLVFFFWDMVQRDARNFSIDDIRIENVPIAP